MPDSPQRHGRTLKLYLTDGSAQGVITAELGISSMLAIVATKTNLIDLLHRKETERTGIYLLLGPNLEVPGQQLAYVGEADQVRTRLEAHERDESKAFFTRVVAIVSKDENLTKAHARYLESRIINAIRSAKRATLVNSTEPPSRGLPEPERADMQRVMEEIEILLPVLGFDVLRQPGHHTSAETSTPHHLPDPTPAFVPSRDIFIFTEGGTSARAREVAGEFVVLQGSLARSAETASCSEYTRRRRKQLLADGQLAPVDDDSFRFTADTAFDSPSGAGSVVYGGSINGRRCWKHETTGQSYGDWREERMHF